MNFCSDQLGTTIKSDKPTTEGYEAENLLKYNPKVLIQTRFGFMTESWIKPAVKLSLNFATCIEISHIVIHPKIYNHQQIASAFLIETRTKIWHKTPSLKREEGPDEAKAEESYQVNFVAKEFINSIPVPDVIVFRNGRFNLRRPSNNLPGQFNKYFQYLPSLNLKHPNKNACERVVGLDITILRTFGSTIPALGKIEVWGQPCQFCPKEKVDHLISNWIRLFNEEPSLKRELSPTSTSSASTNTSHNKRRRLDNLQINKNIEIPEEFLDSLTYTIMQQPLRLPCGLAIDSSTLDKFNSEESKWGRLPNDPFTGSFFTDTIRPILDISLKANIDRFLTLNCQNASISELPRILEANFRPETNRNRISSLLSRESDDLQTFLLQDSEETTQSEPALAEDQSHNLQHINSKDKLSSELFKLLSPNYSKQSSSSGLVLFNGQLQPEKTVGFGLKVEDKCIRCQQNVHSLSVKNLQFYKGLCSHVIICRDCLKCFDKKMSNSCEKCLQVWKTSDCIKIHL